MEEGNQPIIHYTYYAPYLPRHVTITNLKIMENILENVLKKKFSHVGIINKENSLVSPSISETNINSEINILQKKLLIITHK
jgi:hypothetical protein